MPPMLSDEQRAARLRQARERAGFKSPTEAARAFGWVIPTYLSHENGTRGFPVQRAMQYARAFRVNPAWLITGAGDMVKRGSSQVVGYVGAGEQVFPMDDHELGAGLEEVELPPGLVGEGYVALRIRGSSMRPLRNNWVIFYKREQDGVPDYALNDLCVVKLTDGRMYVKELRRGYTPGRFNLESWSAAEEPLIDQEVAWAAPVEAISRG